MVRANSPLFPPLSSHFSRRPLPPFWTTTPISLTVSKRDPTSSTLPERFATTPTRFFLKVQFSNRASAFWLTSTPCLQFSKVESLTYTEAFASDSPDEAPSRAACRMTLSPDPSRTIPVHAPGATSPSGCKRTARPLSPLTSSAPRTRIATFSPCFMATSAPGRMTSLSPSATVKVLSSATFPFHSMTFASFSSASARSAPVKPKIPRNRVRPTKTNTPYLTNFMIPPLRCLQA